MSTRRGSRVPSPADTKRSRTQRQPTGMTVALGSVRRVKKIRAEYIWIDGQKPTAKLRSKTKIIDGPVKTLNEHPEWGFDGSSTYQATGHFSDLLLRPVKFVPDPLHREHDLLVLCEVLNPDESVHW